MGTMNDRPHPAPDESLPSYAARMYDALGIDDLYDDAAWVERATSEGLPNASAEPDHPVTPSLRRRIRDWIAR